MLDAAGIYPELLPGNTPINITKINISKQTNLK